MPQVMNDGVVNQINNPEVEVDVRKPNAIINQEILHLKLITNKLESAYVGRDVDWIDTGLYSSIFARTQCMYFLEPLPFGRLP